MLIIRVIAFLGLYKFPKLAEFCLSQVSKCWVKALLWGLWSLTQFKWTRHESDLQKTDVFLPEHSLQPCKRLKPSNASRTCFHRCWITLKTLNQRGDLQKWLSGYEMASFWASWLWSWRRSTHLFSSFFNDAKCVWGLTTPMAGRCFCVQDSSCFRRKKSERATIFGLMLLPHETNLQRWKHGRNKISMIYELRATVRRVQNGDCRLIWRWMGRESIILVLLSIE